MIILPRQARDKHRKSSTHLKDRFYYPGIKHECFASPLNVSNTSGTFNSLFVDVDKVRACVQHIDTTLTAFFMPPTAAAAAAVVVVVVVAALSVFLCRVAV
jgi:hypothetical protein